MDKQIGSLTSLRGIAASIVVIHHFSTYTLPRSGVFLASFSNFFKNGYLCVDLFFILSGFIMTHVYLEDFCLGVRKANYWEFMRSRFARIYPIHLFTLLVLVGVETIALFLPNTTAFTEEFNLTALFANIFLLQAFDLSCPPLFWCRTYWNEPAWSISVEFVIYCIFPLLLFALSKVRPKTDAIVYILALLSILILVRFTRGNLDAIIGIPSIFRCGLECVLGIITYKVYRQQTDRDRLNSNLLASLAAIWILAIMHNWNDDWRWLHDWAILPAFCLLILAIADRHNSASKLMNSRILAYLGTISYSIYMVHWCLAAILKLLWQSQYHLAIGSSLNQDRSLIALGLMLPIVILISAWTYQFIEVPMRNFIRS
jgi:peptidoglycan/LPS O-acetylase OafA/YrhL